MAKKVAFNIISHETEVAIPAKSIALPITTHVWERIKIRVSECEKNTTFYEGLGWGTLGAAIGTMASLIALWASADYFRSVPDEVQPGGALVTHEKLNYPAFISTLLLLAITIGLAGVGVISLRFAVLDRERRIKQAGSIVEEMESIEGAFVAASIPLDSPSPLKTDPAAST